MSLIQEFHCIVCLTTPSELFCSTLAWSLSYFVRPVCQVYWFKFIVRVLVRILVHGDKVNDSREDEEKDKNTKSKKQN